MCRIAGIINFKLPIPELQRMVGNMCEVQKHGGPDGGELFTSSTSHLVLGNRRLALVDLSNSGKMPMSYLDRYVITFNGEIYNYKELKKQLIEFGHVFTNHTDTEVILAAYDQWGVLAFPKLKGMFAFALWDEWKKELVLARDPIGIKPLYYANVDGTLIFASELKAFNEILLNQNQPSKNWPVYLMAYGHLPEPVTTLDAVSPLRKGCFYKYEVTTKKTTFQSFKHFSFSNQISSRKEAKEMIEKSIVSSVKHLLTADASVGVFLSGGLDSSIVAHVASGFKDSDLSAISLYFNESDYSEKLYQDTLINKMKGSFHQHLLNEDEFHQSFPLILDHLDLPSCDGVNTWFISKYAASLGFKAVLSGVGGDELFGGYPSFQRISTALTLQQMPDFLKLLGKHSASKKMNRLSYLKMKGVKGLYLFLRGHFTPNDIAQQLGGYEKEIWTILNQLPVYNGIEELEDKNKASWIEFNCYLQNQLLRDTDVMSMAHGIEVRVPFLYDDLVNLMYKISPEHKFYGKRPKQILIDIFKDALPEPIWNRPKMGFSLPFNKWLSNSSFVKEKMLMGSVMNEKAYHKFVKGQLHWSQLMSLIILQHFNHKSYLKN